MLRRFCQYFRPQVRRSPNTPTSVLNVETVTNPEYIPVSAEPLNNMPIPASTPVVSIEPEVTALVVDVQPMLRMTFEPEPITKTRKCRCGGCGVYGHDVGHCPVVKLLQAEIKRILWAYYPKNETREKITDLILNFECANREKIIRQLHREEHLSQMQEIDLDYFIEERINRHLAQHPRPDIIYDMDVKAVANAIDGVLPNVPHVAVVQVI